MNKVEMFAVVFVLDVGNRVGDQFSTRIVDDLRGTW